MLYSKRSKREKEIVLAVASQKTIIIFTMQNAIAADNCQSKMWNRMIQRTQSTHEQYSTKTLALIKCFKNLNLDGKTLSNNKAK